MSAVNADHGTTAIEAFNWWVKRSEHTLELVGVRFRPVFEAPHNDNSRLSAQRIHAREQHVVRCRPITKQFRDSPLFANQAFRYVYEYVPVICATTAYIAATEMASFALTSGLINAEIQRTSNYLWLVLTSGLTQVCGPLYFLISHISFPRLLAARRLHRQLGSSWHFSFHSVLVDL